MAIDTKEQLNYLLLKTASLLTESAERLKSLEAAPQDVTKEASSLADLLVAKKYIDSDERDRYQSSFTANKEKIASMRDAFQSLPAKASVLGEVSTLKTAASKDPWDSFLTSSY